MLQFFNNFNSMLQFFNNFNFMLQFFNNFNFMLHISFLIISILCSSFSIISILCPSFSIISILSSSFSIISILSFSFSIISILCFSLVYLLSLPLRLNVESCRCRNPARVGGLGWKPSTGSVLLGKVDAVEDFVSVSPPPWWASGKDRAGNGSRRTDCIDFAWKAIFKFSTNHNFLFNGELV